MKKILILLSCLFMILVIGCSKEDNANNEDKSTNKESIQEVTNTNNDSDIVTQETVQNEGTQEVNVTVPIVNNEEDTNLTHLSESQINKNQELLNFVNGFLNSLENNKEIKSFYQNINDKTYAIVAKGNKNDNNYGIRIVNTQVSDDLFVISYTTDSTIDNTYDVVEIDKVTQNNILFLKLD